MSNNCQSIVTNTKLQEQIKAEYFNNVRRSNVTQTNIINRNAEIENLTNQNNIKAKYISELLDELTQVKLNSSEKIKYLNSNIEQLETTVTRLNYLNKKTSDELEKKNQSYVSLKVLADEYKRQMDEMNQKIVASMTPDEIKNSKEVSHALYDIFDGLGIEYKKDLADANSLSKYVAECMSEINNLKTKPFSDADIDRIKLQFSAELNTQLVDNFDKIYSAAETSERIISLTSELDKAKTDLLDMQRKYDAVVDELETNKNLMELERENSKNLESMVSEEKSTINSLTSRLLELEEKGRLLVDANKAKIKSIEDSKNVISSLYKSKFKKSLTPKTVLPVKLPNKKRPDNLI